MIGENHRDGRTGAGGFYGSFISPDSPDWDSRFGTRKSVYGSLVDDLNHGFRQLGLKTYTSAEINAQVARAEQEAFLNNDLDAAISAADRLSADFMLKGISTGGFRVKTKLIGRNHNYGIGKLTHSIRKILLKITEAVKWFMALISLY